MFSRSKFRTNVYSIIILLTMRFTSVFSVSLSNPRNEKLYLVRYRSKEVNLKPFILDIENKTLEVLANLARGNAASSPQHFTVTDDYIYFTSKIDDQSRQWFRVESELINGVETTTTTTTTTTIKSLEPLIVSPNPTSYFISLSCNFQTISILGSNEELAKSIKNYNASQMIDVS
jgi:hypothetical protein